MTKHLQLLLSPSALLPKLVKKFILSICLLFTLLLTAKSQLISTIAGTSNIPNGIAISTQIATGSMVSDPLGNIYGIDYYSQVVYKISTNGLVSTIAGIGTAGYSGDNGPAINAQFNFTNYNSSITLDQSGNIYLVDGGNNRIRKINLSTNIVTTLLGNGFYGSAADGPVTSTSQYGANYKSSIICDLSGNIYYSDRSKIRKIAGGVISTFLGTTNTGYSGDGNLAINAQINNPGPMCFDKFGNFFFVDVFNLVIRKVDAITKKIATVVGNGSYGFASSTNVAATSVSISYQTAIATDVAGNLFVGVGSVIRKVNGGIILPFAGTGGYAFSGDNGLAVNANMNTPQDLTFDGSGNLLFNDYGNLRIRRIANVTNIITSIGGNGLSGFGGDGGSAVNALLNNPQSIVRSKKSDNLFIYDQGNYRIRKVSTLTGLISTYGGKGTSFFSGDNGPAINASIYAYSTNSLAIDKNDNLYILDGSNRIRMIDNVTGNITTIAGTGAQATSGDGGPATLAKLYFHYQSSIVVDDVGNIYYTDNNFIIRKITKSTGIISTIAGKGTNGFSGDGGPALLAQLGYYPGALAFDKAGNLYVCDNGNSRIRKININTNIISTIAGNGFYPNTIGLSGSAGDGGLAINAPIGNIQSLAFDTSGNLFMSDGNYKIRKIDMTTGIITSFAGYNNRGFAGDGGPASASQFNLISGLSFDNIGNLFVADAGNNRIRMITPPPIVIQTGSVTPFTTCAGTASPAQKINIEGKYLFNNISITVPAGFEVSTSSTGIFSSTINLQKVSNTVQPTDIYIRITSTASGSPNGNLVSTSSPTTSIKIALSAIVNALPTTPTIAAGSTTTFCIGNNVVFTSSATSGNQWFLNGTAISNATASTYSATASGDYTVQTTNNNGCVSAVSTATTVTVNPLPATPTISAGSTTTFCIGNNVVLTSSATSGNQWFLNGTAISNATASTYSATASGDYTVRTTNNNGCVSAVSTATTVTVNPLPATPTISTNGPANFCSGGTVVLTSNALNGNQWFLNGLAIIGATNPTFTSNTSGNYSVQTTNNNKCASIMSSTLVVKVYPLPDMPSFTWNGKNFIANPTPLSIQWILGTTAIPGANSLTYTPVNTGEYSLQVTSTDGCVNTSKQYYLGSTFTSSTSLGENNARLYPNPAHSEVWLEFSKEPTTPIYVRLFTETGVLLQSFSTIQKKNKILLQRYSQSHYYIQINDGLEKSTIKLTIEK